MSTAGDEGAGAAGGEATGAACGKLILLGEHAVVYGTPAIAAGIERGARARARAAAGKTSALILAGRAHPADDKGQDDVGRAFAALLAEAAPGVAVEVEAESELWTGGGLGSSAALGVAIARAVFALRGVDAPGAQVLAAAGAWERIFHGNPSGIDTAAAALGGCFRFTRADGATPLSWHGELWFCVGWSGISSSTREMVARVARLFDRKPDIKERTLGAITSLVENAHQAIEADDLVGLGRLMDLNQMLLAGLFLSTEAIERLCTLSRQAGALGAKLTGAGGGGSVIALLPAERSSWAERPADAESRPGVEDVADRVLTAWRGAGFDGFVARVRGRDPALSRRHESAGG